MTGTSGSVGSAFESVMSVSIAGIPTTVSWKVLGTILLLRKNRIIPPGPTRNQKFWDLRQEKISIHNPEVPDEFAIFAVSLTKSLGDFLDLI